MHDARLFSLRVRVYYEDTDAGGIVYHATYLRWMERARTEWLRALGAAHPALASQDGLQFVVSELDIRYRRPARLDDLLDVDLQVVETRRATLRVAQRTWAVPADPAYPGAAGASGSGGAEGAVEPVAGPPDRGPPLTEATVRIAVMDRRSGRPAPLPRWLLDTLGRE